MPDQDHGCVMLAAFQRVLLQYEGDTIILLPAWPMDRDWTLKLHAPKNAAVEGEVMGGKPLGLTLTPELRRKDGVVHSSQ